MEILIHTLHVLKRNFLPQHHLIKCTNEERVQESAMEDSEANHPANELEIVQMLRVDTRMRVDLECVIIVGGVFE